MSTATTMQSFVQEFLEERHRLGFASRSTGYALRSFATYVDGLELAGPLRIEVMARWARCPKNASDDPLTWARRLKLLRPFARWFRQFESDTEVPDNSIFGSVAQRLAPHIYTEQEISELLAAAHHLQPPLRGATYETLFGLLAATGLRVSEAVHLLDADVDLKLGLLQVRQTKFANAPSFPELVQQFFADYLLSQRAISPNTIASYRDATLLFLDFAHERLGKAPSALRLVDISPDLLLAFLDDLEQRRSNSVHSRNLRLTALRAFLKFAEHRDVASLQAIEQALGVPMKRFERPMLGFLTREEMLAVIGDPGSTWTSQRDHLLLTLLYNTGARVSEIIAVRVADDVVLDTSACVHLHGKGRKQPAIPLWPATAREARAWLRRNPALKAEAPLLPNREGHAMTRYNVNQRLKLAVARAAEAHPSLANRHVSPHCIRLRPRCICSSPACTSTILHSTSVTKRRPHRYVEANLAMKEQALARLEEPPTVVPRYRPPDELRQFLEDL